MASNLVVGSGLVPTTIDEALKLSEILSKSNIVPKEMIGKPNDIFSAIACGLEIGLSPMQSLQSVAVINGRTTIWGDSALALVRGSGKLDYIHETHTDTIATCKIKRINEEERIVTFSKDDAIRAGLWDDRKTITTRDNRTIPNPSTWYCYPKRMMQMRARSFALRDVFPDVLKGISIAEEVKDIKEITDVVPDEQKQDLKDIDVGALIDGDESIIDVVDEPAVLEDITVQTILRYYKENEGGAKGKAIKEHMIENPDWKKRSPDQLRELYEDLQEL